jgi:hypothetical protein
MTTLKYKLIAICIFPGILDAILYLATRKNLVHFILVYLPIVSGLYFKFCNLESE